MQGMNTDIPRSTGLWVGSFGDRENPRWPLIGSGRRTTADQGTQSCYES